MSWKENWKNAEEHGADMGVVTEDNNRSKKKWFWINTMPVKKNGQAAFKNNIHEHVISLQDIVTVVFWTSATLPAKKKKKTLQYN